MSNTDYNNLDIDLTALAADYINNDDHGNRNDAPSTDRRRSAPPYHDSIPPHTTEPPLHSQAAHRSVKRINDDGPDEPGDDDIFDVFAEDEADKASRDARPAKRQTKRGKLSPTSCSDPTSNSATTDPHDGRRDHT